MWLVPRDLAFASRMPTFLEQSFSNFTVCTQSPTDLVKILILIQKAWKPGLLHFSNKVSSDTNAVGSGATISEARVGIPIQDPKSKAHGVFLLPAQCLKHAGPVCILEEWIP